MPDFPQAAKDALDHGGLLAFIGVIGVWFWRGLQGAHRLGRLEEKVDAMRQQFEHHEKAELEWRNEMRARFAERR